MKKAKKQNDKPKTLDDLYEQGFTTWIDGGIFGGLILKNPKGEIVAIGDTMPELCKQAGVVHDPGPVSFVIGQAALELNAIRAARVSKGSQKVDEKTRANLWCPR